MASSWVSVPRASRKRVQAVAERIAADVRREFPQILETNVTFDTREGEDAYLWLIIPAGDSALRRRLLTMAAAKTAKYLDEGIAILPQLQLKRIQPGEGEP
jgi:hypothetical protein